LAKEKQKELAAKMARQMVKMAAKAKKAREQQAEQQQKWAEAQKQAAERKKVEKQAGEEADRFTAVWCSADRTELWGWSYNKRGRFCSDTEP
jgi:hypothetical protein